MSDSWGTLPAGNVVRLCVRPLPSLYIARPSLNAGTPTCRGRRGAIWHDVRDALPELHKWLADVERDPREAFLQILDAALEMPLPRCPEDMLTCATWTHADSSQPSSSQDQSVHAEKSQASACARGEHQSAHA